MPFKSCVSLLIFSLNSLSIENIRCHSPPLLLCCCLYPLLWLLGEGNGNPLQYSCLENPRDRGAIGLPSMGLHRVGHDWSDLAAAAAAASLLVFALFIEVPVFGVAYIFTIAISSYWMRLLSLLMIFFVSSAIFQLKVNFLWYKCNHFCFVLVIICMKYFFPSLHFQKV